ncbi:MAG: hypothetical protein ABW220_05800, partial [Burkholderiaceae bacterium]
AFIVYFNLINLSQSWVTNGRASLGPAMILLHGSALVITLALIAWRDMGTRLVMPWKRPPATPPAPPSPPSGGAPPSPGTPAPTGGMAIPIAVTLSNPTPGVPA